MQRIDGQRTNVIIDDKLLARIEKVAKRTGKTKAQTIRNLCEVGCDVFAFYNATGLFDFCEIIQKTRKKIKGDVSPSLFDEA